MSRIRGETKICFYISLWVFDDSEVVGQEQELVSEEPVCYARVER